MRINERLLSYRVRYPFLFLDYLLWFIFDLSKFKTIDKNKVNRVVVIHTGAIGELVMMTPIIKELENHFHCKIDLLIKESMFDLFKHNPHVGKLLAYKSDFKSLVKKLKNEKYDLAVIFQASFKNALMCYKANVKYRIGGFSRIKRFPTFLYTRRTFPTLITHSLDYSFGIVNKLGVRKPSNLKTEVYVSKLAEKKVSTMVKSPYVVIHPGFGPINSKSPPRSWQNDKYAVIADQLSKKFNVIFSGLADQKDLINDILDKCQNKKKIFNLAGKTNMEQFCALIKNSKLVLAPDTGASHLAASFGVPLVNLMDAPIEEWAPIGKKDKVINIYHPREIAILENAKLFSKVGGVKSISVEEVKKAIDKLV